MKVLLVNILYKERSTGRICSEVKKALEDKGHAGFAAYGKGMHNEKNTYRINADIEYYFHNLMARITGLQGYFSFFATKRFLMFIQSIKPDVIHLQNLHAYYLNLPLLFKFLRETDIHVVLTLHDCWAFTGKCAHYTSIKCFKWKTGCFACPAKKDYPHSWFFDKTKKLYEDKKKWFAGIKDLTIIGVSKWAAEQAKMSFLGDRKILTIYNWVDRNVFYPRKDNVLSNYGVDKSVFTIIGVSASWSPGNSRYEDFIKLSTLIGEDMQIVLVGQSKTEKFPRNVKHISFIKDANELAKLYSSADVFVHMSTEDTFGKVVAEAMACGTPAIVYDSTALPELIGEGCGYKIKANDVKEAYEYIQLIQKNGKSAYSGNCIRFVQENFNYQINVKKLITLYESLIKNDDLHS